MMAQPAAESSQKRCAHTVLGYTDRCIQSQYPLSRNSSISNGDDIANIFSDRLLMHCEIACQSA